MINAENYGERYTMIREKRWDKHPLLEASIEYMRVPDDLTFEITLYSEAPGGASTGTSAAVTVALIGALDCLTPGRLTPHEVALAAQRIETEMLGQQCGIQDQLCSAYGGINYIEMFNYPYASVSQLQIPNATWWELERRLALIYLGKSHRSSDVHEMVIKHLENAGPDCQQLSDLRLTAPKSRDALYAADFTALGSAMTENTEAQKRLHPALISPEAARVIEIAREHGALGLEGKWRRRRWRLSDHPVQRHLPGQAHHDPRDRTGKPALQEYPHLSIPLWIAGLEAGVRMNKIFSQEITPAELLRRVGDMRQLAGAQAYRAERWQPARLPQCAPV